MLDIQKIRDDPQAVEEALQRRGVESPLAEVLDLDDQRRNLLTQVESLKAERNKVSKEIGKMKDPEQREARIADMREVGEQIEALDRQVSQVEGQLHEVMIWIPNLPETSVPDGRDESENVVVRTVGDPQELGFAVKPHWDLGPDLGIIDFEQGVKISGSRFYVLSGAGARLQRALISWMLDLHIQQGYVEKYPPSIVREQTVYASGQLPKFADNLYRDHEDDMWMVPTAEVPLTGIHMEDILEEESLPRRYTAYTPCYRREKMSAGRDVRGIKRGHQFDKVEMYSFCAVEDSVDELERMLTDAEETCRQLGFTYRVVELCAGDLGFSAAKTYDIEVWAMGCQEWLEVSSLSNCTDFQARRANIRYRPVEEKGNRIVHTLNGSGLALPRTLIAVLENNQQPDGCVVVPEILRSWMGGIEIIEPEDGL